MRLRTGAFDASYVNSTTAVSSKLCVVQSESKIHDALSRVLRNKYTHILCSNA